MAAQDHALQQGEEAVQKARRKAGEIASQSASVRTQLLKGLATQKQRTQELAITKQKAAAADKGLADMRREADDAMKHAVKVAGATGDQSKVAAAKETAHSLYRKMVDQKIKIASAHRQVLEAKKNMAAISAQVEKQLSKAKKTANSEAAALRQVSNVRKQVARAQFLRTKYEAAQFAAKYKAIKAKEDASRQKLTKLAADVAIGTEAVTNARLSQEQAQRAADAVSHIRVGSSALDVEKLKQAAKDAAASSKQPTSLRD